ncbi:YaaR family protein [Christensenellaceae bacterium OttesenSCG-928-M15]|nr:YaaR family protein [Christensenellaceae bacterium OttesenSCG-928-M15]
MKIQKIDQPIAENAARIVRDETAQRVNASAPFERHLTELNEEKYHLFISELIGDITEQGKRMAQKADLREFHKYRELVKRLMDETVSNGFSFNKFRKFDIRGRNKTFALIQRINSKLEEITEQLLAEEADHIALLKSVDDIRGMLVDMLM